MTNKDVKKGRGRPAWGINSDGSKTNERELVESLIRVHPSKKEVALLTLASAMLVNPPSINAMRRLINEIRKTA